MSYDRRVTDTGSNLTPNHPLRVPKGMWQAFGRVCKKQGTSRTARIVEMISAEIRLHGDARDLADLEAAAEELKARRSRKGIPHRRRTRQTAGQEPPGETAGARS